MTWQECAYFLTVTSYEHYHSCYWQHNCLFTCLCCMKKGTSKFHLLSQCEGYSPITGGFSPQRIGDTETFQVMMSVCHTEELISHTYHETAAMYEHNVAKALVTLCDINILLSSHMGDSLSNPYDLATLYLDTIAISYGGLINFSVWHMHTVFMSYGWVTKSPDSGYDTEELASHPCEIGMLFSCHTGEIVSHPCDIARALYVIRMS